MAEQELQQVLMVLQLQEQVVVVEGLIMFQQVLWDVEEQVVEEMLGVQEKVVVQQEQLILVVVEVELGTQDQQQRKQLVMVVVE